MLIEESIKLADKPIISLSACSIQGKRHHMEDYYDIGYQLKRKDLRRTNEWPYEYFYFGIFDGHGGSEAAEFAKKNLLKFITQEKDFWSNDDEDVMRAIKSGYASTHAAMKEAMPNWSKANKVLPSTAGTTASVLFIKNGKFYTGHVGDSRIVIAKEHTETKQWIARTLTEDHKPESDAETSRINRAGGEVRDKIGVSRVVWRRPVLERKMIEKILYGDIDEQSDVSRLISSYPINDSLVESYQVIPFLAIARSLGDFWSINPMSGQYIVSPEPDVSCRPVEDDDKCIMLATDGLWNVFNPSMAGRIVQELYSSRSNCRRETDDIYLIDNFYDVPGVDGEHYAHSLVCFAFQLWARRRLRSDNITAVVAILQDILPHIGKASKPYTTRASIQSDNDFRQSWSADRVQLPQTDSYMGKVRLTSPPDFTVPHNASIFSEHWDKVTKYILFPPITLEGFSWPMPKLVYPKNYLRLSEAECRKISLHDDSSDSYILIKRVSDDPADDSHSPTRINSKGKEVRDSSAQATQSIHDFGQPWDQLWDENHILDMPKFNFFEENNHELIEEIIKEIVEEDEGIVNEEGLVEEKDEEVEEKEIIEDDEMESEIKETPSKDKSIPQFRCLLNCTPPLRRSTRKIYSSLSESNKRKAQPTPNSIRKLKRRKSSHVPRASIRARA